MIKYFRTDNNEEVKYNDFITFNQTSTKNGIEYNKSISCNVVNETIPYLIEKGFIYSKEIEEPKKIKKQETCATKEYDCKKSIDDLYSLCRDLNIRLKRLEESMHKINDLFAVQDSTMNNIADLLDILTHNK